MGGASEARFLRVLEEVLHTADALGRPHLVIGGIATAACLQLGWSATGADIDLLIAEVDNERWLAAFGDRGFSIDRTDPSWVFKAGKPDVTVDLIWRSRGDIRLDAEMLNRSVVQDFFGLSVRTPGSEDLLLIKCIADTDGTSHFRECLRMIARLELDWPYLVDRADGPVASRLLSVALYAISEGIWVPPEGLDGLWHTTRALGRLGSAR